VPYESFTFLELLYLMAHRHNQQGYQIGMCKDLEKGEELELKFKVILDYSPDSILQAFVIPADWTFHVKK